MGYGIVIFFALFGFLKACAFNPITAFKSDQRFVDGLEIAEQYHEHFCGEEEHIVHKEVSGHFPPKQINRQRVAARSVASATDLLPLLDDDKCSDMTEEEINDIYEIIERLGGNAVNPLEYFEDIEGFQEFLDDSGVINRFSALEMVTPHNRQVANRCGFGNRLMPTRCRWISAAVQGLVASKLRAVINDGDPYGSRWITLRNWWRPECYNKGVGGAGQSDHVQARGFDLDFATPQERARAQDFLCKMYKENTFSLQVGIGCNTLHVGVGSPKRLEQYADDGSRFWTYASLQSCSIKRLSTDDCWRVESGTGKRFIHPMDDEKTTRGAL